MVRSLSKSMSEPVAVPVKELPVKPTKTVKRVEPNEIDSQINYESFLATKGVPFVADYLGVSEYYKNDLDGETRPKVDEIMKHLAQYGDLVDLGRDVLETISNRINIQNNEKPLSKLDRVYYYVLAEKRLSPLRKKRQKIQDMINREVKKAK